MAEIVFTYTDPNKKESKNMIGSNQITFYQKTEGDGLAPLFGHIVVKSPDTPDHSIFDKVSSCLITENEVVSGTSCGTILISNKATLYCQSFQRFNPSDKLRVFDLYGSKKDYEKWVDNCINILSSLKENPENSKMRETLSGLTSDEYSRNPRLLGFHHLASGTHRITGIQEFNGELYDASYFGVYETETGKRVAFDRASSLVVFDGRLCYVPSGGDLIKEIETDGEFTFGEHRGDLVDVLTREVVFPHLTPFDGSGLSQGTYIIEGDRAFISHGNHPCRRITQRDLRDPKKELSVVDIPGSWNFFIHQGRVYDLREYNGNTYVMPSDQEDFDKALFSDKDLISARSLGDRGILFSTYNHEKNVGQLKVHGESKPLQEEPGRLRIESTSF